MSEHEHVSIPRKILAWMSGIMPYSKKRIQNLKATQEMHKDIKPAVPKGEPSKPNAPGDIKAGPG